jgi:hypothetical protein
MASSADRLWPSPAVQRTRTPATARLQGVVRTVWCGADTYSITACANVDILLPVQLTYGLSTEYTNKPSQEGKAEKVDADRDLFAKYYVNQIMSMDESGIKDAWHKVRHRLRDEGASCTTRLLCSSCCSKHCNVKLSSDAWHALH